MVPDFSSQSSQESEEIDFNNFILEIEPEPASAEGSPASVEGQIKAEGNPNLQVHFKSENGRLLLVLPPAPEKSRNPVYWEELRQQLKGRISGSERFLQPHTPVHLIARDRLLDSQQIQEIDGLLSDAQLPLKRIYASRRQTAVAAATAGYSVEQQTTLNYLGQGQEASRQAMDEPLYMQSTFRSGVEVRHRGTVIVLGDVNPGSSIVAEGDIFVWGHLRGVVHAGAQGNSQCRIMALHMQPTQLRIADKVARSPDNPPAQYQPEVAYIGPDGIRIALASEFALADLTDSGNTPGPLPETTPETT
ncbi:Septum formation inhibitor MinC, C-terminal domain family [Synechococcus sp. PCC 7335]|uniref:septum site-determining protein MinC n=1 Tax=Synechococcus sp. (strain ATCC 29403 / PCC 7335) TaxID=91464 RepID=UPI00017EC051|nr:septum site-determining protein MinC [Synechococcus sp. PCC 7335]EDX83687.1 Septum formation inhibitor MinC, C-terminal domain family [Synechococcus sp. PCC 7335]